MSEEPKTDVDPKVQSQGLKRVPRNWMDSGLDQIEIEILRRIKDAQDGNWAGGFAGKAFQQWVKNTSALLQVAKDLNELNTFWGHYWVQANTAKPPPESVEKEPAMPEPMAQPMAMPERPENMVQE